jgi:hypothetical protein
MKLGTPKSGIPKLGTRQKGPQNCTTIWGAGVLKYPDIGDPAIADPDIGDPDIRDTARQCIREIGDPTKGTPKMDHDLG